MPPKLKKEELDGFEIDEEYDLPVFGKTGSHQKVADESTKERHSVWKSPIMSHLKFWILAFSSNFCPIKTDMSGNTVWPQASDFQTLAKMDHFWNF